MQSRLRSLTIDHMVMQATTLRLFGYTAMAGWLWGTLFVKSRLSSLVMAYMVIGYRA